MKTWAGVLGWLLFAVALGVGGWMYASSRADMRALDALDEGRVEQIKDLRRGMAEAKAEAQTHKARAERIQRDYSAALEKAEDSAQQVRRLRAERKPAKSLKECQQQLGQCDDHAESLAQGFELEKATSLALAASVVACERGMGLCEEALDISEQRASSWRNATKKEIRRRRWKIAGFSLLAAGAGLGAGYAWGASRDQGDTIVVAGAGAP